jgi:hypothetical protein
MTDVTDITPSVETYRTAFLDTYRRTRFDIIKLCRSGCTGYLVESNGLKSHERRARHQLAYDGFSEFAGDMEAFTSFIEAAEPGAEELKWYAEVAHREHRELQKKFDDVLHPQRHHS